MITTAYLQQQSEIGDHQSKVKCLEQWKIPSMVRIEDFISLLWK